ncbi:MAG: serine/threonine protein kinase [Lachnospiraceae bacterium]
MEQKILSGKYKLLRLLGTGGSGSVYLARHQKLDDVRAIKCIEKSSLTPGWASSETELLKNLNHPGIPTIYDLEEDDNYLYIIEEFVRGESLQTLLSESVFIPKLKKIDIALQLCSILEYLHGQKPNPVVYLDLKPEHIFLCGDTVRLVDFGIASYLNQKRPTETMQYGTPGFAAPEQYQGREVGKKTDLYALGAVVYVLLFGQVHVPGQRIPLCMGYGKHMRQFLQYTLAADARERFSSVEEAKAVLELQKQSLLQNKKKAEHLEKNIKVVSAVNGAGGTHLAIALVSHLNRTGYTARYREAAETSFLQDFLEGEPGACVKDSVCKYRAFAGDMRQSDSGNVIHVEDFGTDAELLYEQMTQEETILLVLGSQSWQKKESLALYERLRSYPDLIVVCGFGRKKMAKLYARQLQREVLCFPLEEDLWRDSHKKQQFFRRLKCVQQKNEKQIE